MDDRLSLRINMHTSLSGNMVSYAEEGTLNTQAQGDAVCAEMQIVNEKLHTHHCVKLHRKENTREKSEELKAASR